MKYFSSSCPTSRLLIFKSFKRIQSCHLISPVIINAFLSKLSKSGFKRLNPAPQDKITVSIFCVFFRNLILLVLNVLFIKSIASLNANGLLKQPI